MLRKLSILLVLAVFAALVFGCESLNRDRESPVGVSLNNIDTTASQDNPEISKAEEERGKQKVIGPAWENNIVSEAFYALSQRRDGHSNKAYWNGRESLAMGDWPYPYRGDCCNALGKVTRYMYGSCTSCRGPLGTWHGYQQGGWCKFFVNLVLYRSSYGYPNGHLVLPRSTYIYNNPHNYWEAEPGWIIQSATLPHTAIVVQRLSNGLDVIDSNWVGTYWNGHQWVYSYVIARHRITWTKLRKANFKAYRAHEACILLR